MVYRKLCWPCWTCFSAHRLPVAAAAGSRSQVTAADTCVHLSRAISPAWQHVVARQRANLLTSVEGQSSRRHAAIRGTFKSVYYIRRNALTRWRHVESEWLTAWRRPLHLPVIAALSGSLLRSPSLFDNSSNIAWIESALIFGWRFELKLNHYCFA